MKSNDIDLMKAPTLEWCENCNLTPPCIIGCDHPYHGLNSHEPGFPQ